MTPRDPAPVLLNHTPRSRCIPRHGDRGASMSDYSADWAPTLTGMDRLQSAVPGMYDEDLHDLLHAADSLVGAIETEQRKRHQEDR